MSRKHKSSKKKRLFVDRGKHHGTVVLNCHGHPEEEFKFFAEAFHRTAKEAVDHLRHKEQFGLHGCPVDNFLAYPVLFLYRHALELYMKGVILTGAPMLHICGDKAIDRERLLRTHSLEHLRENLERVFAAFHWGWDFEIAHFRSLADFRKVIAEFQSVDAGSYAFRYPIDKKGNAALSGYFRFNIFDFCEALDAIFPVLDGATYGAHERLETKYEEMAESRQYELEHVDYDAEYGD